MCLVDEPSVVSSSMDLQLMPEDQSAPVSPLHSSSSLLDAPKLSSDQNMCPNVQFSLQDLRRRRQKRQLTMQYARFASGSVKLRRFLILHSSNW